MSNTIKHNYEASNKLLLQAIEAAIKELQSLEKRSSQTRNKRRLQYYQQDINVQLEVVSKLLNIKEKRDAIKKQARI